jgi:enoyl-CoA hydratase/carnithine racemase
LTERAHPKTPGVDDEDPVLYAADDGVGVLTLNRPDRLNAWTPNMERRFFEVLEIAGHDPMVRVLVITGAGRGFCAGADAGLLNEIDPNLPVKVGGDREVAELIMMPKLIVAAINGACAGLGLVLAAMCDIRFAAAGAKFSTAYARLGLVAENGSSWILPRLVGPSRALDLLASARVFRAEEALQMGLVDRVFPAERVVAETLEYAREVATVCSPRSIAAMKWQIYRHAEASLDQAIKESLALTDLSLTSPDFKEGIASYSQRRPATFPPLADDEFRDPFTDRLVGPSAGT